jgi:hypothetical protein
MTVLSISSREMHEKVTARGCVLVRINKHAVYKAPNGHSFTMPSPCGSRGHRKVTGAIVRAAARALGTTTKELLGTR